MWWRRPDKPIREQLVEAQATLERQIEIMRAGPIRLAYQAGSREALEEELREINEALANLAPDDS